MMCVMTKHTDYDLSTCNTVTVIRRMIIIIRVPSGPELFLCERHCFIGCFARAVFPRALLPHANNQNSYG